MSWRLSVEMAAGTPLSMRKALPARRGGRCYQPPSPGSALWAEIAGRALRERKPPSPGSAEATDASEEKDRASAAANASATAHCLMRVISLPLASRARSVTLRCALLLRPDRRCRKGSACQNGLRSRLHGGSMGISEQVERPKVAAALGERVRTARRELGLSQAQLAGQELTKGFISQLESGIVRPSIRSLQVIASRLGKPLDYFIADEPLAAGKRLAFHRLAAETAAERRDWAEVRRNVGIALEHSPEARERAHLLHLQAITESADHSFERTFALVSEAMSLVDPATEPNLVGGLLYLRGTAYGELGRSE